MTPRGGGVRTQQPERETTECVSSKLLAYGRDYSLEKNPATYPAKRVPGFPKIEPGQNLRNSHFADRISDLPQKTIRILDVPFPCRVPGPKHY